MAKLTASPPTVIIDVEQGQTQATAQVGYEKERDHVVWERTSFDAWMPHSIPSSSPTDVTNQRGDFPSLALEPGDFYEAVILKPDIDANAGFDRAEARLAVGAVRKRPEERSLYSDGNDSEGGTWCAQTVFAHTDVIALLQVSPHPPAQTNERFIWFPSGAAAEAYHDFAVSHNLEIDGLLPGSTCHAVLRLSDKWGNWQCLYRQFTTLRRTVTVKLVELHVDDDGDDMSNGEGTFDIALVAGPLLPDGQPVPWTVAQSMTYANSNFSTGEVLQPGMSLTHGPEAVTDANRALAVSAHGNEDDSGSVPLDDDDETTTEYLKLPVAQGRVQEIIKAGPPQPLVVHDLEGDFRFTAFVTYAVDYVP